MNSSPADHPADDLTEGSIENATEDGNPSTAPPLTAGAEPGAMPAVSESDAVSPDVELVRTTAEAVRQLFDAQHQALMDIASLSRTLHDRQQRGAQVRANVADAAEAWRRLQERNGEQARQARDAITPVIGGIWSWIKRVAKAAGEKVGEFYLRCAPPNWTTDPDAPVVDYVRAVRLALDEGLPLAWVPDQETVRLLVGVPGTGTARRVQLHRIIDNHHADVLDSCDTRLDEIARYHGVRGCPANG